MEREEEGGGEGGGGSAAVVVSLCVWSSEMGAGEGVPDLVLKF